MQSDIGDQGEEALDVSAVLPMMRRGEVQPPRWWYPVGRRVVRLTPRHFELHQFDPRALSSSTTSSRPWCREPPHNERPRRTDESLPHDTLLPP
jgi:hypothetical protein